MTTETREPLSPGQRWAAAGAVAGMTLAGAYGLAISYETVRHQAERLAMPFPAIYPLGIEGGMVAVLALDLLLTWIGRPIGWLRQVARLLAVSAVAINAYSGWLDHGVFAAILHALPPLLLVVGLEAARHHLLRIVADEDTERRDPIPRVRWLLSPLPTLILWRRMALWQITSYRAALDADLDRREITASLHREFGRRWAREIPADVAYRIRTGVRMADAITTARAIIASRHPVVTTDHLSSVSVEPDEVRVVRLSIEHSSESVRPSDSSESVRPSDSSESVRSSTRPTRPSRRPKAITAGSSEHSSESIDWTKHRPVDMPPARTLDIAGLAAWLDKLLSDERHPLTADASTDTIAAALGCSWKRAKAARETRPMAGQMTVDDTTEETA